MVYKINVYDVYDVPFPPKKTELMADVSLEIDNIVLVNGIKIKERTDGSLYVEMPKIADTENKDIFEGKSKFVAIPSNKEFATELYSNIIKTYRSKKQHTRLILMSRIQLIIQLMRILLGLKIIKVLLILN